jgi:hypothetical protein
VSGGVGERYPHIFGLGAVDEVAQDPAPTPQTLSVAALTAVAAHTAGDGGGAEHGHAVADGDIRDFAADLDNGARELVPEDHGRIVAERRASHAGPCRRRRRRRSRF